MARFIYAMHDPGGEHLMEDAPGWVVHTIEVRAETALDYSARAAQGFTAIGRLNWSYGEGTIARPEQWGEFAHLCAEYVRKSRGCDWWVVANEPNHPQEQIPGGPPLTVERYVDCYHMVYEAIKRAAPSAKVMPAAIAPWAVFEGMGWIEYFDEMMHRLEGAYDGINLHTYSRGYMPAAVASEDRMDAPWDRYRNGFRSYRDFLAVVPASRRYLPVHITETNGNGVWPADRSGWVQAAYAEIDGWNATPGTQKVCSLALFRWPKFDQRWQFETKSGVHADFRDALARGYRAPDIAPAAPGTGGHSLHIPTVLGGGPVPPPSPPAEREWDERLTARGVTIETPQLAADQWYWRAIRGRWYDVEEAKRVGPDHHILADMVDERGQRTPGQQLLVEWPGERSIITTEAKPSERWAANYPMSPSHNEFSIRPASNPAERVTGIGMGADLGDGFNVAHHTSTEIVWQLTQYQPAPLPNPPIPDPVPPPAVPQLGNFQRALEFVLRWEGGWADNPNDPGGATMQGITLATFTRWRHTMGMGAPTKDDLRNIQPDERDAIYYQWYWLASGSHELAWPLCLAQFDTAVNAGVGRASEMMNLSGGNFLAYMGHLMSWYTRIPNFEHFGRAWIRRRAEILLEAAK